ncbi:MAG: hypothetical protein Q9218_007892 [Villophora microphyllina]
MTEEGCASRRSGLMYGSLMSLDCRDKNTGSLVYINYTGIGNITPELGMILGGDPNAKSTEFGDSFIEMRFETGDEKLKELENGVFVGAGRFIVEQGKPVVVEYKVSKLVKGSV